MNKVLVLLNKHVWGPLIFISNNQQAKFDKNLNAGSISLECDWWRDKLEWMEVIFVESNTWSDDVFQSSYQSPTYKSTVLFRVILT